MKRLLFIPILLMCSLAYSAPGTLSIDTNLTVSFNKTVRVISGSSFGAKSPAEPWVFHDFENGVNGQLLDTAKPNFGITSNNYDWTFQRSGSNVESAKYSNTQNPTNSTLTAMVRWDDTEQSISAFGRAPMFSGGTDNVYIYYKRYLVPSTEAQATSNVKQLYIFGDGQRASNSQNDYPQALLLIPYGSDGWCTSDNDSSATDNRQNQYFSSFNSTNNVWQFWEVYAEINTVGQNDGMLEVKRNNVLGPYSYDMDFGQSSGNFDDVRIGHMYQMNAGGDDGEGFAWYDNVYVDNTRARVMLGDNPVYADCEALEIQIPTAWASGEITATMNQGSFTGAENLYLYVIDEDGGVSPGLSVSGAGGAAPGEYDTTVPSIGGRSPASSATGIIQTTDIDFTLSDELSGVNLDWVTTSGNMSVSGVDYASSVTATGTKENVSCTLANVATGLFTPGETVTVGVNTKDEAENQKVYEWSFTIEDNTIRWGGETLTLNGETFTLP